MQSGTNLRRTREVVGWQRVIQFPPQRPGENHRVFRIGQNIPWELQWMNETPSCKSWKCVRIN